MTRRKSAISTAGRLVGGMDVVDQRYAGYAEAAPQGRGPVQSRIFEEGNAYLERELPRLDRVLRARIIAR